MRASSIAVSTGIFTLSCLASCAESDRVSPSQRGVTEQNGTGGAGGHGGEGPASAPRGDLTSGGEGAGGASGAGGHSEGGGGADPGCVTGSLACDGTVELTCDPSGEYGEGTDCALIGQICVSGVGCAVCLPGSGTCVGDVGTYCNDEGSGFAEETCDPLQGTTCNSVTGRCTGSCAPKAIGSSYMGCDYFPTVTANLVSPLFTFAAVVANTSQSDATITVTQGSVTLSSTAVAANSVAIVGMPWNLTLKGPSSLALTPFNASVKVTSGAYRLRSTEPVTVYQFSPLEYSLASDCSSPGLCSYTNDASLLLPTNVWTGTYRVASRHHFFTSSGFYTVTAKENGTTVTLTSGPQSGLVKAGIPGVGTDGNGVVELDQGDVIEVVTNGTNVANDPNDLTGTLVQADKPVQVIGGHQCIYVPYSSPACDHLEETIFPYETLANDYIVTAPLIPTGGATPKVEMVRVVATQPATTIAYDPPQAGAPTSIALAGGWFEIESTAEDFRISANQPILVVQTMEGQEAGGNAGDPAMTLAVPEAQYRTSYLFHAPTNYDHSYANIVAPTGETVTLDGQIVAGMIPIGNTGYSVARVSLSNEGNGNHTATGTAPFGISVYGYGQYTSYWYPAGADLIQLHQ